MKAELVEKTSKDGNKYVCLLVHLTPTYAKTVFLDEAEKEILRQAAANAKGQ